MEALNGKNGGEEAEGNFKDGCVDAEKYRIIDE
jgi:hypothetical protein